MFKDKSWGEEKDKTKQTSAIQAPSSQHDKIAPLKNLRVTFSKNQRNRGHSSKFNLAHTLSIGRPRSHTYYKDVRLLKFSLV